MRFFVSFFFLTQLLYLISCCLAFHTQGDGEMICTLLHQSADVDRHYHHAILQACRIAKTKAGATLRGTG